jgi:hypothetical protein
MTIAIMLRFFEYTTFIVEKSYRSRKIRTVIAFDSYFLSHMGTIIDSYSYRSGNKGNIIALDSYRCEKITIAIMYNANKFSSNIADLCQSESAFTFSFFLIG